MKSYVNTFNMKYNITFFTNYNPLQTVVFSMEKLSVLQIFIKDHI